MDVPAGNGRGREQEHDPRFWLRGARLTEREIDVALLAGRGVRQDGIARQLQIRPGTVRTHLARASLKLDCRNAHDLRLFLLQNGLVQPHELIRETPPGDQADDRHC